MVLCEQRVEQSEISEISEHSEHSEWLADARNLQAYACNNALQSSAHPTQGCSRNAANLFITTRH